MRSSPDPRRIGLGAAVLGVVVLGIVAERQRYGWADTRDWAPDLIVGWTLAGLGIAAFALRRPRGAATLLFLSGATWFAGNFYELEPGFLGPAAEALAWLFLAALVQLALAYPTGTTAHRARGGRRPRRLDRCSRSVARPRQRTGAHDRARLLRGGGGVRVVAVSGADSS